jgi:hypothetical protein
MICMHQVYDYSISNVLQEARRLAQTPGFLSNGDVKVKTEH